MSAIAPLLGYERTDAVKESPEVSTCTAKVAFFGEKFSVKKYQIGQMTARRCRTMVGRCKRERIGVGYDNCFGISAPATWPVIGLTKCTRAQAAHVRLSYVRESVGIRDDALNFVSGDRGSNIEKQG
jgi:hypothetical protein